MSAQSDVAGRWPFTLKGVSGRKRRPKRATAEQRSSAERWLARLGREVIPEAVAQLAPHVKVTGEVDLVEVQAFARLVRLGQVPTEAAVAGQIAAVQAHELRRRREEQAQRDVPADLTTIGREAARYVQDVRDRTGHGPSWGQLSEHAGWSRAAGNAMIVQLRQAGWLRYDRQPGSLRAGPAFTPEQQAVGAPSRNESDQTKV